MSSGAMDEDRNARPGRDGPLETSGAAGTTGVRAPAAVAAGEARIRRALRWSLVAAAVAALGVAAVTYLKRREPPKVPIDERPLVLPRRQLRAASPPLVRFTEVTEAAGIRFAHENGARGKKLLPETMGPGCAFFDLDRDEDPDLLLVNGKAWTEAERDPEDPHPTPRLYGNDGRGRFADITAGSGLDVEIYGMGAAVGDYDGDGWPDVFLSCVGHNRLFHNRGGTFEDVTAEAGVAGGASEWSTSAGFFDYDNDGDLDLLVLNYVRWSPEIDLAVGFQLVGLGRAYGPPTHFEGAQPYLYRNGGDGTFREVAREAGLYQTNPATGVPVAKALGLVPLDTDRDGWIDVVVANDTVRNFLFHNQGDGTFREIGAEAGVAYDSNGAATGAMGIDAAYYRNDGTLGIGVGNFATEMTSLYVAEEALLFHDEAITEGIGPVSRQLLSFGLFFFDYDLDGRQDLFQTNGHLEEEINKVQPSQRYRQPSQLFWNSGPEYPSSFVPVDGRTAGDLVRDVVGRGAAYADIDGDGDLDLLITQTGDRAVLLRNDQNLGHGWIRLRLVEKGSRRDAIGARVELEAGGDIQRQQVMPTRSYLSQVEPVLTFGLGAGDRAEAVRIWWPGAEEPQRLGPIPSGTYRVIERE